MGEIGLFKIVKEDFVVVGICWIEVVIVVVVEDFVNEQLIELVELCCMLKLNDLKKIVVSLQEENKDLKCDVEKFLVVQVFNLKVDFKQCFEEWDGMNFLVVCIFLNDVGVVKDLVFQLECEVENVFVLLVLLNGDKVLFIFIINKDLVVVKDFNVGQMI